MDIEGVKRRMLIKYPAFGSVVANLKYIESKECGTAATDGDNLYYNPDFLGTLTEDEQVFLFAHEVCHVAFNHIFRSEGKDKKLWNIATDAVINALLKQDGLKMVEGGVDIPEAAQYDVEQMYEKLLEEQEKQQNGDSTSDQKSGEGNETRDSQSSGNSKDSKNKNESQGNNQENSGGTNGKSSEPNQSSDDSQDVGHDSHTLWEEAIKKAKENSKDGVDDSKTKEKESLWDKLFNRKKEEKSPEIKKEDDSKGEIDKSEAEKKKDEQIEKLTQAGEKKAFSQNKIDRKKQLDELREALARESVGFGNETNSTKRDVGEIGKASPLVDWRKLLKEAINANVDWSYKNADIEDGVVTPHIEEFPRPETEIVLDTSGSIHETLLRNFLRECKNILAESKVKVGCFDTKFYGFNEIRNENDIENMRFQGGGGTDFNVAVNAFSRRVENKIIFTDGEAPMPEKAMDAIWIVFGEDKIKPKGGKVITITRRQLERLCRFHDIDMSR